MREAVEQLTEDQRKLIELAYFEQMSVREAARLLNWHSSKAQRCHEAARDKLHKLLGVQSGDELQVEIGLAAWLSLASARTPHLYPPAGIEAAAEKAGHGATHLWGRAQEIVRRFLLGGAGEPSSTIVAGSAARTAGACGAAALACLASGMVGPGVGGVDLLGIKHHNNVARVRSAPPAQSGAAAQPRRRPKKAELPPRQPSEPKKSSARSGSGEESASNPTSSSTPAVHTTVTSSGGSPSGSANSARATRAAEQTSQEFSPLDDRCV